jgi:ATP-dependent protease ClpP protease subunit
MAKTRNHVIIEARNFMSNEPKVKNAVLVNEFTEYGVKNFKVDFDDLNSSSLPIIPVIIDSFGGEVYSLLAMLDIISTAVKPVATIALGKAMSCGSILLACGTEGLRFVGPHATVMVHDVATVSFGKIEELKADVGEAERLNIKIFELLNNKCSKPKGYFQKIVADKKHTNWYLDAKEVIKHGLADHVGLPVIDSLFNLDVVKEVIKAKVKDDKVVLREKRRASKKRGK